MIGSVNVTDALCRKLSASAPGAKCRRSTKPQLDACAIDDVYYQVYRTPQKETAMARVDVTEAECAIREWAHDLVNADEGICSLIAEAKATAVGVDSVDVRSVWRGKRGNPHFAATIVFKGEEYWPCVLSDAIVASVKGTFTETRAGLTVDEHTVEECDFDKTDALAANAYWDSQLALASRCRQYSPSARALADPVPPGAFLRATADVTGACQREAFLIDSKADGLQATASRGACRMRRTQGCEMGAFHAE
jgi:hypothetical protein